jgi:hypothetical protein
MELCTRVTQVMNCFKCQRQMSATEPVWYRWVRLGWVKQRPPWPVRQRGFHWARHYLCASCVEDKDERYELFRLPDGRISTLSVWAWQPCEICARPIYYKARWHRYCPRACSVECRKVLQNKRRKEWRKERIQQRLIWDLQQGYLRQCECRQCRKVFTQKRQDARFCSNACRQKHYRSLRPLRYG